MSRPFDSAFRLHRRSVVAAVVVTVLWSSSWVLLRLGLDDEGLPPLTFAGLRYSAAAIALWLWVAVSPKRRAAAAEISSADLSSLLILGVMFYAVTQGAQVVAIDNQPAATSSLVLSMTPLLVGVLSHRSLSEQTSSRQLAGSILVIAGAAAYLAGDLGATVVGMTAALVGLAANVASALLGRSINRGHVLTPLTVTSASMTIGAAVLLGTGLSVEAWPELGGRAIVIILWLAVVNTAFAFTLWNLSLRHLSAMESAGLNNTMLVQIALLAWVFLGEFPGVLGFTGIAVVTIGVLLTQVVVPSARPVSRPGTRAPDG